MWVLAHTLLLGVAVVALADGALRLASLAVPGGLLRVVAAAPLLAGAAVLWALLLGLVGLGTSPAALTLAALASALAARVFLPAPPRRLAAEVAAWWHSLPAAARLAVGALAGLVLVQLLWMWRHPWIGADGFGYHLPDALAWIRDGRPGSEHEVLPLIPVQNYALTYEVLLSWLLGISRSFTVLAPLQLFFGGLLAAAAVTGLQGLGVRRPARLLVAAVAVTVPMIFEQLNSVANDLPALALTVTAAALCAHARMHPRVLGAAALAAGLSIGIKSTGTVPAALALAAGVAGVWRVHRSLPWTSLILGATAAVITGGIWYLRNLVQHGSPLWPLVAAPWGTPSLTSSCSLSRVFSPCLDRRSGKPGRCTATKSPAV